MSSRLLLFAAVVAVAGSLWQRPSARAQSQLSAAARAAQLVPAAFGPFRATRRWDNRLPRTNSTEVGADYADGAGAPLQYDLHLGYPTDHNGIGCYLTRGEILHWYGTRRLATADAQTGQAADFELALARDDSGETPRTVLIAATECRRGGCRETTPVEPRNFGGFSLAGLLDPILGGPASTVTPLSIVVLGPSGIDPSVDPDILLQRLKQFVSHIRLAPIRAFTAGLSWSQDTRAQVKTGASPS